MSIDMTTLNDNFLLDFIPKYEKHAWVGGHPPFDMDIIDLESCSNFRLAPNFHQKYDAVWFFEKSFEEYNQYSWKIILDESIRMLKETGFLVLRMHQSALVTVPMIKAFIGRNININSDIEYESVKNGEYTIIFKIERLDFEAYQNNAWTFAMLTSGTKDENVIKFLESIRKNDKEFKHEIIISGPQKEIYDKYGVKYLDLSHFRDSQYAEISKKKNAIANMASNPNLMIVHDRYYLSDTFFQDFEKYGYDFDFLALRQTWEDGKEFPYYCFLYYPIFSWTHPVTSKYYEHLFETQYVNGGLMVFKTHSLNNIKFNPLLLWEQQEDVEITQEFMKNSLVPRVNYIAHAITFTNTAERAKIFEIFDEYNGKYIKSFVKHPKVGTFPHVASNKKKCPISIAIKKKRKFPFISIRIKLKKEG